MLFSDVVFHRQKRTYSVNLDDAHIMPVNPEEEHGERRGVNNTNTVSLAGLEGESCVLVKPDFRGYASRACSGLGTEILTVLREVDEGRFFRHNSSSVPLSKKKDN